MGEVLAINGSCHSFWHCAGALQQPFGRAGPAVAMGLHVLSKDVDHHHALLMRVFVHNLIAPPDSTQVESTGIQLLIKGRVLSNVLYMGSMFWQNIFMLHNDIMCTYVH